MSDSYIVPGLLRGIEVLELIAARGPMRGAEVAQALGTGRSTAHRLLHTLRHAGLTREGAVPGTHALAPGVLRLGFAMLEAEPLTARAAPHLRAMRDAAGIGAHLSVLDGTDALYLASERADGPYVSTIRPGHRIPAHACGNGWVLLGGLNPAAFEVFAADCNYAPRTRYTPRDAAALRTRVEAARNVGHVLSRGFSDPAGASLSVPVRGRDGRVTACLSLSGPLSGFDFAQVERRYLPAARAAATSLSRDLGHGGP
ncbi:MAG: IclR family transcriptional regulator [Pseudomonadota bacterium]